MALRRWRSRATSKRSSLSKFKFFFCFSHNVTDKKSPAQIYEMATGSGAFCTRGGFNQSGGGNYVVVADLTAAMIYDVPTGVGSGGAATFPAPVAETATTLQWAAGLSSVTKAGSVLKDMGKTYISSQRTFRKFQAVSNAVGGAASFGVTGQLPLATANATTGYFTFYLETSREAQDTVNGTISRPRLARYM